MPYFIVERSFDPPLTRDDLDGIERRMASCLDLYNVRWIRSFWSADRGRMVCEYEAPDAASVRKVQDEAGANFDRVWSTDVLGQA